MKDEHEFVAFVGPMFSSKTGSMIRELDRLQRQGRRIAAFKPDIDGRYTADEIATHDGDRFPAHVISTGAGILSVLHGADEQHDVVALDEAFMVPGCADVLMWLHANGITVYVASLDLSFQCEPFDEIVQLLPFATRIEKLSAICSCCPAEAHYTYRKGDDEQAILIGGDEMYEARCIRHHPLARERLKGE